MSNNPSTVNNKGRANKFLHVPSKQLIILLIGFILIVGLRYDNLFTRPLGFHNEDATAHVLVTMKAFDETPAYKHLFLPIFTLGEQYNKWINDLPSAAKPDKEGNYYYTSFPPFGFIAPYLFTKILFLPIDVVTLRIFNLLVGSLAAYMIYKLVRRIVPNGEHSVLPLIASFMYMLSEESLWSHANAYWAHSLLQPLWIIALYLFYKVLNNEYTSRTLWGMGFITFVMCYTEWTAFIMAFLIFTSSLYMYAKRKQKEFLYVSGIVGISTILSGLMTLVLFASKVGMTEYLNGLLFRASERKGNSGWFADLFLNYWIGFGLFLIIPLVLFMIWSVKKYENISTGYKNSNFGLLVVISWIPIVENILLLEHAAIYTFATLKLSVPIILTTVYVLLLIGSKYVKFTAGLVIVSAIWSIGTYFNVNEPVKNDHIYSTFVEAGQIINDETNDDELALINRPVRGHLIHYAERNIVEDITLDEAIEYVKSSSFQKGKYYIADGSNLGFDQSDSMYQWGHYGYISGYFELNGEGISSVTIYPARYTDDNWERGISRGYNGFFVHNSEILATIKSGDILQDENGATYTVSSIVDGQVWFNEFSPDTLNKATRFKLVTKEG